MLAVQPVIHVARAQSTHMHPSAAREHAPSPDIPPVHCAPLGVGPLLSVPPPARPAHLEGSPLFPDKRSRAVHATRRHSRIRLGCHSAMSVPGALPRHPTVQWCSLPRAASSVAKDSLHPPLGLCSASYVLPERTWLLAAHPCVTNAHQAKLNPRLAPRRALHAQAERPRLKEPYHVRRVLQVLR